MSSTNMSLKNNFTSYNFENASNINKFVENTLEELKDDTHLRQNDGTDIDSYEYYDRKQQCFDTSIIKKEPSSLDFGDLASSTCMSFSPSSSENVYEEKQYGSVANSLNKNGDSQENHPPIWEYELESTLETKNPTVSDIQTSSKIQEGYTTRLLGLFETSYSDFKKSINDSKNNQENVISNELTNEAKQQKKLCDKNKIEKNVAYQLGRQKGIREILTSIVSPISTQNTSASLDSPELSFSCLQRENMILLNKLAGNGGSLTRTNFEETSNVYAANISKEESRVNAFVACKESKLRRVNEKLELEALIKTWLKPFWNTDVIKKDDYKNIMLKCVRKTACWKEEERIPVNIRRLVEFYIKKICDQRRMDKSIKSAKNLKHSSLKNNFSSEKSVSKKKRVSEMSETQILLKNVSNNKINSGTKKKCCSGKGPNIQITIEQSCCNTKKQFCCKKKSEKSNSNRNLISGEKESNTKRWRY